MEVQTDIASDGTNHLAVWADNRNGGEDIYATRIEADGTVLDRQGIQITSGDNTTVEPAVAFTGTDYLVVWREIGAGPSDVLGARVGTDGTVKDATPFVISAAAGQQFDPHLAFDGSTTLIVWADRRTGVQHIYGTRWTASGGVLDPAGIALTSGNAPQGAPAVVSYGAAFLTAWTSDSGENIYVSRVEADGDVLDPEGDPLLPTDEVFQSDVALAFDGTNVLVVFTDTRNGGQDIYGTRWNPTSGTLDPSGIPISRGPVNEFIPEVAFNRVFLVIWEDNRNSLNQHDIFGARVTRNGTALDPDGFVIADSGRYEASPAVDASTNGRFLTAYTRANDAKARVIRPK